jgi:hypothetical protein
VPVKSTVASRLSRSTVIFTLITWPVSVGYSYSQSDSALDHPAHAFLGIVLHVAHVGLTTSSRNGRPSCAVPATPFSLAAIWAFRSATFWVDCGRVGVVGQQLDEFGLAEAAALDHLEIVDQHAFLVDGGGERRHRAGRHAADIGVVAARGRPEQDRLPSSNTGVTTVMSGRWVPPL